MTGITRGRAVMLSILVTAAVLAGCSQDGTFGGGGVGDIEGIDVYWADDGAPDSCSTDGVTATAIARDTEERFEDSGTLVFQWKSDDGWQDFARSPTDCSSQGDALFCEATTQFGMSSETAIDGVAYTRAVLRLGNQSEATSVAQARVPIENQDGEMTCNFCADRDGASCVKESECDSDSQVSDYACRGIGEVCCSN